MGRFDHLEIGDTLLPRTSDDKKPDNLIDQNTCVEEAQQAFAVEDYERALSAYSRALNYDQNMEQAWFGQLRCMVEMGRMEQAVNWSNMAVDRFPESSDILAVHSAIALHHEQAITALACSEKAVQLDNANPYAWAIRGQVLLGSDEVVASECFDIAAKCAPDDPEIHFLIGKIYLEARYLRQALKHFTAAASADTDNPVYWYWHGRCHQEMGHIEDARFSYERALRYKPGYIKAKYALDELKDAGFISKMADRIREMFDED